MYELKTRAGIEPDTFIPVSITTSQVVKYLAESILGVTSGIKCEFTRWTGVTPNDSYVRMRVLLAEAIVAKTNTSQYAGDRILAEYANITGVREDIVKTLAEFVPPTRIDGSDTPNLQRLYTIGVSGNNLEELVRHSKLTYVPEEKVFSIILDPGKIIKHMLADPDTGAEKKFLGNWKVDGTTSETITWKILIDCGSHNVINANESFDKFFR